MSGYVPYRTASFLGEINEIHHLFAVMNDPCGLSRCLVINVTSIKDGRYYDAACVLNAGDHPFIKHPSYMLYRLADTVRSDRIGKFVDLNYYLTKQDWHPDVFQRIIDGIRSSDDTSGRIVKYADTNGIV